MYLIYTRDSMIRNHKIMSVCKNCFAMLCTISQHSVSQYQETHFCTGLNTSCKTTHSQHTTGLPDIYMILKDADSRAEGVDTYVYIKQNMNAHSLMHV